MHVVLKGFFHSTSLRELFSRLSVTSLTAMEKAVGAGGRILIINESKWRGKTWLCVGTR